MPLQSREREVDIMQKPKISVIMGVYNQWNVIALKNAVRSILDQTWEDFEFIIFDDVHILMQQNILKALPVSIPVYGSSAGQRTEGLHTA